MFATVEITRLDGHDIQSGNFAPIKMTAKSQMVSVHSKINSWFWFFSEFLNNRKHNATLGDLTSKQLQSGVPTRNEEEWKDAIEME